MSSNQTEPAVCPVKIRLIVAWTGALLRVITSYSRAYDVGDRENCNVEATASEESEYFKVRTAA
jgi:hypothetical protein